MKTFVTIVVILLFVVTTVFVDYLLLLTGINTRYLFGIVTILDIVLGISFSIINDYLLLKLDN